MPDADDQPRRQSIEGQLRSLEVLRELYWVALVGLVLSGLVATDPSAAILCGIVAVPSLLTLAYCRFKTLYFVCPRCNEYFGSGRKCNYCGLRMKTIKKDMADRINKPKGW
jgi:hypothetical protein